MKKILITSYNLDIGGIETSLVNLLKNFNYEKYDVTLILEDNSGMFLKEVPKEVKVIDYKLSHFKIKLLRKIKNRMKLILWILKNKNKYDFSICFATHSILGSYLARYGAKNNAIWVHGNYYEFFNRDINKMMNFFNKIGFFDYKNYVFVSHENKDTLDKYVSLNGCEYVINNIINGDEIKDKCHEKIEYKKDKKKTLFINVSIHDESQKKLSRIIKASKELMDDGYEFEVLMIGDGPDKKMYEEMVHKNKLDNNIKFLGKKFNPFPYYKIADAILLSSDNEGYPVVFNEARILGVPLITTKVSDYKDIDKKYGIVVDKDKIYEGMKQFLDKGFDYKQKFDYKKYNAEVIKNIENIIDNVGE